MIVLDYDGRVVAINPAGARLMAIDATAAVGRSLAELGGPVPRHLATLAPGEQRLVSRGRRTAAAAVARGTFVDRGFRRSFFTVEELTDELRRLERAAHEKLIRLLSHEVNNTVGAAGSLLQSCLTYGAAVGARRPLRLRARARRGDRAHGPAQRLHARVRRRVPPARPAPAPGGPARDSLRDLGPRRATVRGARHPVGRRDAGDAGGGASSTAARSSRR